MSATTAVQGYGDPKIPGAKIVARIKQDISEGAGSQSEADMAWPEFWPQLWGERPRHPASKL